MSGTGAPDQRSAIVLAGGLSKRFGSDKLTADLDGAPLLHHAIRSVASTCEQVIVVLARDGPTPDLPTDLGVVIHATRDEADHPGPLAALLTGARGASGSRLLLVAGDMPSLRPAVLDRLLRWTHGEGACLIADDEQEVLPLALDRDAAITSAERALGAGERSLRALIARLDLEPIAEVEWRTLDPDGATLRDVDVPEDLARRS